MVHLICDDFYEVDRQNVRVVSDQEMNLKLNQVNYMQVGIKLRHCLYFLLAYVYLPCWYGIIVVHFYSYVLHLEEL
jgi:hypothetical protein